jgi:hypothetical protein
MDDLIILIIQAIARMLKVEAPKVPPRPQAPVAAAKGRPPVLLRRAQGRRLAPPPIPGARRSAVQVATPVVEERVVPGSAGSQTHVGPVAQTITPADTIRKLLTPENLRRQFILTEIFQPPMALREPQ